MARLTAAPIEIVFDGRSYRATPLTLADYGEIDQAVLGARPDPLARAAAACQGQSEALQQALLSRTFDELLHGWPVTSHEVSLWMSSREGMAHILWLAVRAHQPEMSLANCRELLAANSTWLQAERALDRLNGLPPGKLPGRARRPKSFPAERAESPGEPCFAN